MCQRYAAKPLKTNAAPQCKKYILWSALRRGTVCLPSFQKGGNPKLGLLISSSTFLLSFYTNGAPRIVCALHPDSWTRSKCLFWAHMRTSNKDVSGIVYCAGLSWSHELSLRYGLTSFHQNLLHKASIELHNRSTRPPLRSQAALRKKERGEGANI